MPSERGVFRSASAVSNQELLAWNRFYVLNLRFASARRTCFCWLFTSGIFVRPVERIIIITFRVSRRRREMHIGLCVCLSLAACPHYCTDPHVTWRNDRGCPLVAHYWAHLQLVHGFRCYDNIAEREMSASACTRSMPGSYSFLAFIQ